MKPQMKIGDVSRVTGVPIPMLGRWLDRQTIQPSRNDKPSVGTGDHRTFSRATINKIAIAKKLIELGINAGSANEAASLFTDNGQYDRVAGEPFSQGRTILALRPTGAVVLNAQLDADFSELSDFGVAFAAVDCGKVCTEIDSILNTPTKPRKKK